MNERTHHAERPEELERLGFSHGDEYRLLRDEVMQRIRNIHQMELLSAIGVGFVYSWLILHTKDISLSYVWFAGPTVILFCALSCLLNTIEMWRIGLYLQGIEAVVFAADDKLNGWEHEQRHSKKQRFLIVTHLVVSLLYWVLALGVTTAASIVLSRV